MANARQHLENCGEFIFGGIFDGGIFGQGVFLYLLGGPLSKVTEPRNAKPKQMKTITRRAFARVRDKGKPQLFAKFAIGSPIRLVLSKVWRQKSNGMSQRKHRKHGGSAVK